MRVFLTLWRREVMAFFLSPIAYVIMVFFLLLMGLSFWMLINILAQGPSSAGVMRVLFGESLFFWLAMLMVVPVTTMRLFAEERRSGTIETLMTAPVGDVTIVMAKYLGALAFFIVLWAPTTLYAVVLMHVAPQSAPIDWGTTVTTYLGTACIGAFFLSVGVLTSALTRNQAVAAIACFAVLCTFFFAGFIPYYARTPALQEVGRYVSSVLHMMDFSRGAIDTRPLIFYLSLTAWTLFATVKVIESRKWKS